MRALIEPLHAWSWSRPKNSASRFTTSFSAKPCAWAAGQRYAGKAFAASSRGVFAPLLLDLITKPIPPMPRIISRPSSTTCRGCQNVVSSRTPASRCSFALLDNALVYAGRQNRCSERLKDQVVRIRVTDTGVGIPRRICLTCLIVSIKSINRITARGRGLASPSPYEIA